MTSQEHSSQKHPNRLINESSPYLKQHAYNPVDWYPWGEEALQKAEKENKPILLSIGYSSCHWCHVMAHESFENDSIAAIMNENFVNIKLDREERPDIDQIYMDAVQAMGLRGGWPLNVFLTPDQKPFYGGTYFPPEQWTKLLQSITEAYNTKYDKLYESASQFAASLKQSEAEKYGLNEKGIELTEEDFDQMFQSLQRKFDSKWGGIEKAPKFPMPALWQFLAVYQQQSGSQQAKEHLLFTLDKIASGGIYDHVGGGFSRYSVDAEWHVPHFEKMLYDNGQLLSLYASGYKITQNKEYSRVMKQTATWLQREMMDEDGGFYSALDADSEGEEGKFYVWSYDEIQELASDDFSIIAEYFNVEKSGNWEHGKNVLRKLESDDELAHELGISEEDLQQTIDQFIAKALDERSKRIRPGLDDKIISGWNGLALSGLCEAYQATGDPIFESLAHKNAKYLKEKMIVNQKLKRISTADYQGYLEDYAAVIQAFIHYYETFFDESFLTTAKELADQAIAEFYDESEGLFYYTSDQAESLIARKKEIFDNVIPSSNAIMALNLHRLGLMFDHEEYKRIAFKMVYQVNPLIKKEPEYLSYWAMTSMMLTNPTPEVIILGNESMGYASKINANYLPNKILMASKMESKLPLFEYKSAMNDQTTIYVCYDKVCKRPVHEVAEAISQMESTRK